MPPDQCGPTRRRPGGQGRPPAPRVRLDLGHRALAEHPAGVQHCDDAREPAHEVHVVLDHDDRAVPADRLQQVAGLVALLVAHAGDRLVEQQQPRVLHQQHADLQPLLLAVREHPGEAVGQRRPDRWSPAPRRPRRATPRRRRAAVAQPRRAPAAMSRFCSTVSSSKTVAVWNVRPTPSRLIWCTGRPEQSSSPNRTEPVARHQAGDRVDQRGLAGAVRARSGTGCHRRAPSSETPSTAVKPSKLTRTSRTDNRVQPRRRSCRRHLRPLGASSAQRRPPAPGRLRG